MKVSCLGRRGQKHGASMYFRVGGFPSMYAIFTVKATGGGNNFSLIRHPVTFNPSTAYPPPSWQGSVGARVGMLGIGLV